MKTVVITGCLGFIGSHIVEDCLSRGYRVYGIDSVTYAANISLIDKFRKNKNFYFCEEDICKLKSIPDCDYVINTAAETHVGNSIIDSSAFTESNILGVQNILEIIKNKPNNICERPILLQFSTDEVYGDITVGDHTETDLLNPSNPYSASKAAADLMISAWARTYGIKYIIVRPTNNYGKYQYPEKLIPLSVKLLQRGKKIRLHNKGTPIRNWLHAADTSEAIMTIMDSGEQNQIYNIAGGFEQANIDTVKKIIERYNPQLDWDRCVDLGYSRQGQDIRYSLDDSKVRALGWKPKKIFDEEIGTIVDFYKKNFRW